MNYINVGVTLILFIIGYFIKVKKVTWLISGYNTSSKEKKGKFDIDKLTHNMGNFVYLLALVWAVMSVFTIIFPLQVELIMVIGTMVFTFVIVGGVIWLNTGNRVMKD
ncbi:MAG: DUF3784 domain-containing protein [Clostridiales bacterium]|nr:DUF3784 domain-containing protein [Clostridiales bacterium]